MNLELFKDLIFKADQKSKWSSIRNREALDCEFWIDEDIFNKELEIDGYILTVDNCWGGEGDGAEMGMIIKATEVSSGDTHYIEFSGYYSSWDSSAYNTSALVEPYEKTVTRYRPIKD